LNLLRRKLGESGLLLGELSPLLGELSPLFGELSPLFGDFASRSATAAFRASTRVSPPSGISAFASSTTPTLDHDLIRVSIRFFVERIWGPDQLPSSPLQ
jgi:hypothetical protein